MSIQVKCWKCDRGWVRVAHGGDVAWDTCPVCDGAGTIAPDYEPEPYSPYAEEAPAPIVRAGRLEPVAIVDVLIADIAAYHALPPQTRDEQAADLARTKAAAAAHALITGGNRA